MKKFIYFVHFPYSKMINQGQTLGERVSSFFKTLGCAAVLAGITAAPLSCTLALATYAVLEEINSPGVVADSGSSHIIFLKNSWLNPVQGVYIFDADGSDYRLLLKEESRGEWRQASLSPGEEKVVLVNYDWIGPDKLFVINTNGSRLSQLTFPTDLENDSDPFWVDCNTIGFLRINDKEEYLRIDVDENNIGYNLRPYDP